MEKWVIGKIPLDREVNKVNTGLTDLLKPTFQHSNIPTFHHSIIPCAGQKLRPR